MFFGSIKILEHENFASEDILKISLLVNIILTFSITIELLWNCYDWILYHNVSLWAPKIKRTPIINDPHVCKRKIVFSFSLQKNRPKIYVNTVSCKKFGSTTNEHRSRASFTFLVATQSVIKPARERCLSQSEWWRQWG